MYKVCGSFAVALLVLFAISTVVIMLRPTPKLTAPAFRSRQFSVTPRAAASSYMTCSAAGFKDALSKLQEQPGPHYVIFSADRDPVSRQPWCPDCVRALPPVIKAMQERKAALLEVEVGPRSAWKDKAHPFRTDPELKITGIPTLMFFGNSSTTPLARLGPELEAAGSPEEATALVKQFIQRTAP